MKASRLIGVLGIASLCACSSTTNSAPLLPATSNAVRTKAHPEMRGLPLTIRIRVPHRRHREHFVSPATRGAALSFSGPSTVKDAIGLKPSSNATTVSLAAGKYVGSISTFDAAPIRGSIPASAKLLASVKNVPFTIARGRANQLNFILDGVPVSITIDGFPSAAVGTPFSKKNFTVQAHDAEDYVIVGTYATPIKLVDTDTSGATSIATDGSDSPPAGELIGSSDSATISYNGHAIAPVKITASAGRASGAGIFAVKNPLIVTNNLTEVLEISANCNAPSCGQSLGGGFTEATGVATDPSGDVFVSDTASSFVKKIPAGCSSSSCVVTIGGGFSLPFGLAADSSGNVYVADKNNSMVKQIPSGCASSACVKVLGGGFIFPFGVAIDAKGNVYVGDTGHNEVKEIPPGCTTSGCVVTLGGGFNAPLGVAPDGSGGVYVADSSNHAVKYIPSGCTSAACVATIGGGFNGPTMLAYDGANVFVVDYTNQLVQEIPPGCTSSACVTTVIGNLTMPYGIAIP